MKMTKINLFGQEFNLAGFVFLTFLAISLIGGCTYRVGWWQTVENYDLPYKWDRSDGSIIPLNRSGWHRVTPFFTKIYTVDSRPMQIRIEANNRVLNAMLVRFRKEGALQFFELHGLDDYDQGKLSEILKSYAYEGYGSNSYNRDSLQRKYKFLEILGGTSGTSSNNIVLFPTKKDTLYESTK